VEAKEGGEKRPKGGGEGGRGIFPRLSDFLQKRGRAKLEEKCLKSSADEN